MRKSPGRVRLQVEGLEAKVVLSTISLPGGPPTAAAVHNHGTRPHHGAAGQSGPSFRGTYQSQAAMPDTGSSYTIQARGQFGGAPTDLSGTIHTPGFIKSGQATGTLHTTLQGVAVTLDLIATAPGGSTTLPRSFSYSLTTNSKGAASPIATTGTVTVIGHETPGGHGGSIMLKIQPTSTRA